MQDLRSSLAELDAEHDRLLEKRERLDGQIREVARKRDALRVVLEEILHETTSTATGEGVLSTATPGDPRTVAEGVRVVVESCTAPFSAAMVEDIVRDRWPRLLHGVGRGAVSAVLSRMAQRSQIEVIKPAAGRSAARYGPCIQSENGGTGA